MQAVLYICHGSRVKEACEEARFFVSQAMADVDVPIQEVCFLELAEPSIEAGFRACVERGATSIAAVPILLLTAAHAKEDIPNELAIVKQHYPDVAVTYGEPFGVHDEIISILMERIGEERVGDDAMVLLVGRGSSDPDVKHDMKEIAARLQRTYPFQKVDICFLAAAEPTFEQGLEMALASGHKQIFVVPYLLFTGILRKTMERTIKKLGREELILCDYLGYHPNLRKVLAARVNEAMHGCSVCPYEQKDHAEESPKGGSVCTRSHCIYKINEL